MNKTFSNVILTIALNIPTFLYNFANSMNKALIFRLTCVVLLWVALIYLLVSSQPFTLKTLFLVIASGVIVFVPLYKTHFRNGKQK